MVTPTQQYDITEIDEARLWLLDCFDDEFDKEIICDLPPDDVIAATERYYEGGWSAFRSSLSA